MHTVGSSSQCSSWIPSALAKHISRIHRKHLADSAVRARAEGGMHQVSWLGSTGWAEETGARLQTLGEKHTHGGRGQLSLVFSSGNPLNLHIYSQSVERG